ncbi:MAG: FAD-binding oxidoreductase [Burkholderiaceae bacterium]
MNLIASLQSLVGPAGVLDAAELAKRSAGVFRSSALRARALVRPTSTEEVAAVLRWCHEHGIKVVPQGGLTGLVHGADAAPDELILSTERLRTIEHIDPSQRTATVQAGVTLQALQEAALDHGLMYPLDLGARGTATVGGNAATNAGGNRVIRYGMTRDMVLGLEAVLADGTIVSSMSGLIKNNTGYDLKQLFIGSEGTLGVITRLVLRLREKPLASQTALVAVDGFDQVGALLRHMDRRLGGGLSAFEVMWQSFYRLVTTPPAKGKPPLSQDHPFYVLIESQGADPLLDDQRFESAMESAMDAGLIVDAAIAQSEADSQAFWGLRDDVGQIMHGGAPVTFDVSLPIGEMNAFVSGLETRLPAAIGEHRLFTFGHLGDGNLHVSVQVAADRHAALKPTICEIVYGGLQGIDGSVSAEHGIGLEKKPWLPISRTPTELAVMRAIKQALDPRGLLNPGKVLD